MAAGILYRLEDCFNDPVRTELLKKLSFDDVPAEVLQSILYSDDGVQESFSGGDEDDYAALQEDDELVELMTMVCEKNEEPQWWDRNKIDQLSVDQFMKYFVRSKLFRRTVKRLLDPVFSSMKMEVLQLASQRGGMRQGR